MPSDGDYEYDAVLRELGNLSGEWRIYRDTINRAIGLLNHEVLEVVDRLDKNDADRTSRQAQLDVTLHTIQIQQVKLQEGLEKMYGMHGQTTALLHTVMTKQDRLDGGQRTMRLWQWVRLGTEVAVILIIAAFLFGVNR